MAPHDLRRPFKRPTISDQQKRREISLLRQAQHRRDAQQQARCLASTVLSLENPTPSTELFDGKEEHVIEEDGREEKEEEEERREFDVAQASRLKGPEARKWFAKQLMIPEWMIDVPDRLNQDWYVFARPAGKRCFVVSSKGTTVSRLRNGAVLHHFPSALSSGSRKKTVSDPAESYSVLDCIFHEPDQKYYVIDMVCWRGYSLHDCSAEFRFFWMNSMLAETGACDPPSTYHKYRFCQVPVCNCDESGLQMAYSGAVPYVKDGLLLYNNALHELANKRRISVTGASKLLANILYSYRGMGLSVGTMVAGWDETGPGLYYVDSEGGRLKGNRFSVGSGSPYAYGVLDDGYRFDMSIEEAAELARRAIYHATFRDGASGGVVSVYYVGPTGWKKLSGDDVSELHYHYNPVSNTVEQEMADVSIA